MPVLIGLKLEWPPSVNHYYARSKTGGVFISKRGMAHRATTLNTWNKHRREPASGLLRVEVTLYPPDNRRRDIDNVQKCLFDSMGVAGVFNDDSQIDDLRIMRARNADGSLNVVEGGMVSVFIEEIGDSK